MTFLNSFFWIRDSPYLKAVIWDFKAKWGWDSGLKACAGSCGMLEITFGITGLGENLRRDDGIEESYW